MCSIVLDGINHIAEIQKTAIGVSLLLFISLGLAARNGSWIWNTYFYGLRPSMALFFHLPNTRDSKAMQEELLQYSLKMRCAGQPELGALKTGQHDDLVTSCLLAVHWLTQRRTTPRVKWF